MGTFSVKLLSSWDLRGPTSIPTDWTFWSAGVNELGTFQFLKPNTNTITWGVARRIWFTTAVQLSASVTHGSWKRAQAHSHGIDYKARGGKNEKTKTTVATIAMQCHSPQTRTPTTAELRPTPNQLDTWLSPQFTPVRIIIVTILAAYAKQTKLAICPSFIFVSLGGAEAQSPASCGHIYRDRKD